MKRLPLLLLMAFCLAGTTLRAQPTAIRAGQLIDVEQGVVLTNQIILVEDGQITAVGADIEIPNDARVIDLSASVVLPGLIDAHTHLALTEMPGNSGRSTNWRHRRLRLRSGRANASRTTIPRSTFRGRTPPSTPLPGRRSGCRSMRYRARCSFEDRGPHHY